MNSKPSIYLFIMLLSCSVSAGHAGTLLVINKSSHSRVSDMMLLKKLKTGFGPIRIASYRFGKAAALTNSVSGTVQTFDLDTMTLASTFQSTHRFSKIFGKACGGLFGLIAVPITLLVREDQATAYVSNSYAGNITLIDLDSGSVLKTFHTSVEPDGLALSPLPITSGESR